MDLPTISPAEQAEARERFIEYRDAVRDRHSDEDAALRDSFKAVSEGRPVIALTPTIAAGGRDDHGLPKLAVCRADAPRCYLEACTYGGSVRFATKLWREGRAHNNAVDVRSFPAGTLPELEVPAEATWTNASSNVAEAGDSWSPRYTIVPIVPPALRPASGALHRFDILWEVEEWAKERPAPPVDPALLRHMVGDLYAVVAVWDLTDLERTVLGASRG